MNDQLNLILEGKVIPELEVNKILIRFMEKLARQDNLLVLSSPIVICGDVHGQLEDVIELFKTAGINDVTQKLDKQFIFMGDYVDRGYFSMNTLLLLVVLSLNNPGKVWLLRGNHESRQVSQLYGFYNEIILHYGHNGLFSLCNEVFDLLPLAAIIDSKVFCVHGGLSPRINILEQINELDRKVEIPSKGPMADLTWSDPSETKEWRQNSRGSGYTFGKPHVDEFCLNNKLNLICRSHQLVNQGYQYYFGDSPPQSKLVNIWSAPNYQYRSRNKASIMYYDGKNYDIKIFEEMEPSARIKRPQEEETSAGYYFC